MKRTLMALALLICFAHAARAEVMTAVMPVFYKNAAELVEPLAKLLSEQGKIAIDPKTNSLIVRDWRVNVYAVREELKKRDAAPQRVRITAALIAAEDGPNAVRWEATGRDWGKGSLREGLDLFFGMEVTPMGAGTALKSFSRQTLLIDTDKTGRIIVSDRVPDAAWLFRYGLDEGYISPQARFRDIATAFTISCVLMEEGKVVITFIPTLVRIDGGSDILFHKAAFQTVVSPGRGMVLGEGEEGANGFGGRFLTLAAPDGTQKKVLLVVLASAA